MIKELAIKQLKQMVKGMLWVYKEYLRGMALGFGFLTAYQILIGLKV